MILRIRLSPPSPAAALAFLIVPLAALLGGCISHDVKFEDVKYAVPSMGEAKTTETAVVAVISTETLEQKVRIKSWMSGIANNWETEPGLMLRDVADIEFPQVFGSYLLSSTYAEPTAGERRVTVVLTIPSYDFAEFKASVSVHAAVYGPNKVELLQKTYSAVGPTQGAKMFWGGAFAMKSALRQSSLAAYKTIFEELRTDLQKILASEKVTLPR